MKITQLLAASVLGLASSAASAIVWLPDTLTNGDYQAVSFASFGVSALDYDLVFFDAGTTPGTDLTSLTITSLIGVVDIVPANTGPFNGVLQGSTDTAQLGGTAEFELALYDITNDLYVHATGINPIIDGNWYTITFGDITGQISGVDLQPVPVPAAVWLFGTGLLGLVGVARRKKA